MDPTACVGPPNSGMPPNQAKSWCRSSLSTRCAGLFSVCIVFPLLSAWGGVAEDGWPPGGAPMVGPKLRKSQGAKGTYGLDSLL